MKKIVFVIGQLSNGGAERVVSVLANSFISDYEVSIVTVIDPSIEYDIDSRVSIIHINTRATNKIVRIFNRYKELKKIILEQSPDIVISLTTEINIYSIMALKGISIPLIISERNDPYNDPPSKITRLIRDIVYKWADGYVFQTDDAKKYFEGKVCGPWKIIPNPLNGELPDARKVKKEKKIVTVSRLYIQKNIPLLLSAFAEIHKKYPEYRLEIFGEGPLKEKLQELSDELGICSVVDFKGFCRNVYEQIQSAEIFVLTSNFEGMSNAMLEAIAMGIPSICTDCPIGGARMVITNYKNGILIPVNDKTSLVCEIDYLLSDRKIRKQIADNGYELRNQLSIDVIKKQWMDLIYSII